MVDEEVVNGRLEKTRVDLYSSSSLAKSAASSQATPTPSQCIVVSEEAPEELVEVDLVVVGEEDCRFKASPPFFFGLSMARGPSIPGIFAP